MKNVILSGLLMVFMSAVAFAGDASNSKRALFAYMKVQPGTETQFLQFAKNVIGESRKEPGNLAYVLQRSVSDPQEFVLYELFKSDADLETHKRSKHVVDFLKEVNPLFVPGGFTLVKYDQVDAGASVNRSASPDWKAFARPKSCDDGKSGDAPCFGRKTGESCGDGLGNVGVCRWDSSFKGCSCVGIPGQPD